MATQTANDPPVHFQYIGSKGLTVIGRMSGRRYRFDGPGAVITVDIRDKQALSGVPTLRQVRDATDGARLESE